MLEPAEDLWFLELCSDEELHPVIRLETQIDILLRKAIIVFGGRRGERYLGGLGFGYVAVALRRTGPRA